MKIVSYNVNGIRAALGKDFAQWLNDSGADVVCIQETKAQPEQVPLFYFQEAGYHSYWYSAKKKGYSGVAILTRKEPDSVVYGMGNKLYDDEGRVLRADYGDVSVISVYHPSGSSGDERQDFKMQWLLDFHAYVLELQKTRPKLVIAGDYNICHQPIDIHDPIRNATSSGFLPEEREWMGKFLDSGFTDTFRFFDKRPHQYSWWSFRAGSRGKNLGWRIDYIMTSKNMDDKLVGAGIEQEAVHSDHCPVWLDIQL